MTGQELIDYIVAAKAESLPVCLFTQHAGPITLMSSDVAKLSGNYILDLKRANTQGFGSYLGIGAETFFDRAEPMEPIGDSTAFDADNEDPNDPRMTMTFDQIVENLLGSMDEKARKSWLEIDEEDIIEGHHTTGRSIRNTYGLWTVGNPTVPTGKHPDDVSYEIMMAVWKRVHEAANKVST